MILALDRAARVFSSTGLRPWLAGLSLVLGMASAPAAESGAAAGLIVRLKQAPPHAREGGADPAEARRWQRVLSQAGLGAASGRREPGLKPVGRDQQRLDFGRLLGAAEAAQLAAQLARRPEVDWVEPNTREQALQVPTDPMFAQQWWLQPVSGSNGNVLADRRRGVPGFLRAWQTGLAGSSGRPAARVAVLDTGITAHPDLVGRILPGYDFVSEAVYANDGNGRDADPADPGDGVTAADLALPAFRDQGCTQGNSSWHGTLIAGLIAASTNNGEGVAGIHHDGRIVPVRVAGKCGANLDDIVDGMRWAAGLAVAGAPINANPARIVNISFGGSASCGNAYQAAVNELRQHGVLVVAAAGNGAGAVSRPASCAGVVGVTALNRDGFKAHYANFGAALAASGLATVGGDDSGGGLWGRQLADSGLVTVWNAGVQAPGQPGYAALFGTSFAAPLVAGTAALMLSVNPALTVDQLIAGLRASARPHVTSALIGACSAANPGRCICSAASCGIGMLDAEQALLYAARPADYVAPARQPEGIDSADVAAAVALGPDLPGGTEVPAAGAGGGTGGGAATLPGLLGLAAALIALRSRRFKAL